MMLTRNSTVAVPKVLSARAREQWPELRDASDARILRYALALALGSTPEQALESTRDARLVAWDSLFTPTTSV